MCNYRVKAITLDEVKASYKEYPWMLVYEISDKKFGLTSSVDAIDWNECVDARFFSEAGEIHCFQSEDGMQAVQISDVGTADVIDRSYYVNGVGKGKVLVVRHYLQYDEDGQAYISMTRLVNVRERGEVNE